MGENLPGEIDGLLRACSPVVTRPHGHAALVMRVLSHEEDYVRRREHRRDRHFSICGDTSGIRHGTNLSLNLSDPTGRLHAVWWMDEHVELLQAVDMEFEAAIAMRDVVKLIRFGDQVTPTQIESLRYLVVRMAKAAS